MEKEMVIDVIGLVCPPGGLVAKYLMNISTKSSEKLLNKRLNDIDLTKLELLFVNYILDIASKRDESIDNIEIDCSELMEALNLQENDFNDIRYNLESYEFLGTRLAMGNCCACRLNYSLFWKSNYLELTTEYSLNFEYLLKSIIDYLYLEKRHLTEEVDIRTLSEKFTTEQINPVLAYLHEIGVAQHISYSRPQVKYLYFSFFLDKPKLVKVYKSLLLT